MVSWRRVAVLVASLGVLAGALYGGYRWYQAAYRSVPSPVQAPRPDTEKSPPSSRPPEDIDVALPENLHRQQQQETERRNRLFERAKRAHRSGDLKRAANLYREALEISGPDKTAARAYRYLGDLYDRTGDTTQALRYLQYAIDVDPSPSISHFRLGLVQKKNGRFERAESALREAIERESRPTYYLALGNLYFEQEKYDEAADAYTKGLDRGGGLQQLHVNRGLALQRMNDYAGAIAAFRNAREGRLSDSVRYRIAMNKGRLHLELGETDAALEEFKRARSLRETPSALFNLGEAHIDAQQYEAAVEVLEIARDKSPRDASILTELAYAHEQLSEHETAARLYARAAELDPKRVKLHAAAGRAYERAGMVKHALDHYRTLSERLSDRPSGQRQYDLLKLAYRRAGELYLRLDRPGDALQPFRQVLKMEENLHSVHYNMGVAFVRSNRVDSAIESFGRAVELKPDSVRYRYSLAEQLYRGGRVKRALDQYKRVVEQDPAHVQSAYMIGYIHYSWGDLKRARRRFQGLLQRTNDNSLRANIHQNLGNVYMDRKQYSKAQTAYQQALAIEQDPVTYYNLGLNFVRQKQWSKAARSFRYALQRGTDTADVRSALGLVLYKKGLFDEAEKQLQLALEKDPDNLRARYDLKRVRQSMKERS